MHTAISHHPLYSHISDEIYNELSATMNQKQLEIYFLNSIFVDSAYSIQCCSEYYNFDWSKHTKFEDSLRDLVGIIVQDFDTLKSEIEKINEETIQRLKDKKIIK